MALDFIATEFPERIAFGAMSDPNWSTDLAVRASGHESTNQAWQHVRHTYDVSLSVRTATDYQTVRAHFNMARGRAKAFLFKDFLDHAVTVADGVLTATATTNVYQLHKRYGSGADLYDRRITRPVSPITVYRTRTGSTTSISPTIDYTTGLVTVSGHVDGDAYTWAGEFRVPCRYDTDRLPSAAVNKQPNGDLLVDCSAIPVVEVRE
jgi:uncharacterized protein (TIGR02217 family)